MQSLHPISSSTQETTQLPVQQPSQPPMQQSTQSSIQDVVALQRTQREQSAILTYLQNKGFKKTENVFTQECDQRNQLISSALSTDLMSDAEILSLHMNYSLPLSKDERTQKMISKSYSDFREWVFESMEMYKGELFSLLYPIFVHCYIELVSRNYIEAKSFFDRFKQDFEESHPDEIRHLQGVITSEQCKKDELVQLYEKNQHVVHLSEISLDVLRYFLSKEKSLFFISGIINSRIKIQCYPSTRLGDRILYTPIGIPPDAIVNRIAYYWGLFAEQLPKNSKSATEEDKKKMNDVENIEGPAKKLKTEIAEREISKPQSSIKFPKLSPQMESELIADEMNRMPLSSKALPSICFYTFFNAHQMMNNVELSNDGSTIVGCFQDSTVRLWDVKKVDSQRVTGAGDIHSLNASTCFLGHSGPVYAASLTNSNNPLLLLTASEDRTVRLWDCSETKSSLVCYRGHNYPVWDVSFSSLSFFFATASHDRTARLWATDRIYPVRIFVGHLFDVNCVRFHPNCNAIATGSNDRSVRLWDINSGRTGESFIVLSKAYFNLCNSIVQ